MRIADLVEDIRDSIPECIDSEITNSLSRAVSVFCRETYVLYEDDSVSLSSSSKTYAVQVNSGYVLKIDGCFYSSETVDRRPIPVVTREAVVGYDDNPGQPLCLWFDTRKSEIVLQRFPENESGQTILFRKYTCPNRDSIIVPDILERWSEAIIDYSLHLLHRQRNKPWTDIGESQRRMISYSMHRRAARQEANLDAASNTLINPRPWR